MLNILNKEGGSMYVKLKELRTACNQTCEEFGKVMGTTAGYYKLSEQGSIPIKFGDAIKLTNHINNVLGANHTTFDVFFTYLANGGEKKWKA